MGVCAGRGAGAGAGESAGSGVVAGTGSNGSPADGIVGERAAGAGA